MKYGIITATCALALSGTAFAEAGPAASAPAPADPAQPSANAQAQMGAQAQTDFTDTQIGNYAKAATKIRGVQQDATMEDSAKQAKMMEIVTTSGLEPATFNAISRQMQTDAELKEKVQLAIAQNMGQSSNQ